MIPHHYKPIRMKWTPAEQRVFELLSMRRYAELAEFCNRLADTYKHTTNNENKQHIWR